ncbi:Leucyl aminopeptidase yscIV [Diatrype stigma]|uniref:Leucyl aminopeptidase yscIV n=1 Tax=Diatrype stigma TaxID=117547 RepID=A0AAN9V5R5_9PEZI
MRGASRFARGSVPFKRLEITIRSPSFSTSFSNLRHFSLSSRRMAPRDPNTLANYGDWRMKHTTVNFKVNFEKQRLEGSVLLELESLTDKGSKEIILDTNSLSIASIKVNSSDSDWKVKDRVAPYGSPLHVSVPDGAPLGEVVRLDIGLQTTKDCVALQWLTPAQTGNKKHPYVYSQCQAILARSLFPCQDTPDVKSTYTFNITSPLPVVASGVPVPSDTTGEGDKLFRFEQKVPIPSYLFALASGDLATAPIGKRSVVATEPEALKGAQWEFEDDMDKFLQVAEKLIFDYKWGEYNILVLPPSFAYGGMENPIFTFATPTVVSGDRQNVDVIAQDAVALLGADHEFTKLIVNHKGVDPEDAFSSVPYEKGFHFLYYLDRLVGRENFDKFIPHYFKTWAYKSLDSFEFKKTFLDFFEGYGNAEIKEKIATIPWEERLYAPGLPPKPDFNTAYVDTCLDLAEKWKQDDYTPDAKDTASFTANQMVVFLQEVQKFSSPLSAERSHLLGTTYKISSSKNVEVKSAYYLIALRAEDRAEFPGIVELLGSVGRMKFVRPLYRKLNEVDRDLAVQTFEKSRDFYPSTTKGQLEKDLGLR